MVPPVVPPHYRAEWHRVEQEQQIEAEEAAARAVSRAERVLNDAGLATHSMVRSGHPADEIIDTAEEIGADLVVVGSKGLTGGMLFLLGSVSQKVMKYAPCSVLLTKPVGDANEPGASRVVLATDGSDNALGAARFLSFFRLADDAEIIVMNVVQQFRGLPRSSSAQSALEQVRQSRLEDAQRLILDTQNCISTEARITTAIVEGDPAEQILQSGSEMNADLIVVGSKGLGGIKLFLLGSVSQRVCRYSDRSVMLIKMR
jgi:nucleotide-binding universal stress UspA family protein